MKGSFTRQLLVSCLRTPTRILDQEINVALSAVEVVVMDRVDLPVPYWRPYLRKLLGVGILHVYFGLPPAVDPTEADMEYHFTMGFKDIEVVRVCVLCWACKICDVF